MQEGAFRHSDRSLASKKPTTCSPLHPSVRPSVRPCVRLAACLTACLPGWLAGYLAGWLAIRLAGLSDWRLSA
eukprot:13953595-Heterocapsa_arctica.AAC.1